MSRVMPGMFDFNTRVQMEALNHRTQHYRVTAANIANAETPGYRALGYDFETQLQALLNHEDKSLLQTSHPKHLRNPLVSADGDVHPEVYIRPTETISHDGNTVDLDHEMAEMSSNQLLYRATVEFITRKMGILRYAINGGGR